MWLWLRPSQSPVTSLNQTVSLSVTSTLTHSCTCSSCPPGGDVVPRGAAGPPAPLPLPHRLIQSRGGCQGGPGCTARPMGGGPGQWRHREAGAGHHKVAGPFCCLLFLLLQNSGAFLMFLLRICELMEQETAEYYKTDPDPFDDRHPGSPPQLSTPPAPTPPPPPSPAARQPPPHSSSSSSPSSPSHSLSTFSGTSSPLMLMLMLSSMLLMVMMMMLVLLLVVMLSFF